ncbi:Derlin 1 [Actinomortierella wolfii]|nr:Derlin 1 [Actinomortierella wolfii]
MAENELMLAYKSIPIVTRTLLTSTIVCTFATAFGLVQYPSLALSWNKILYSFHIHRLFTAFSVSSISLQFVFDLYLLYTYGSELEETTFGGRTADYVWCIIFTCITSAIMATYLRYVFLFQALLSTIVLLWSLSNSERIVSFMFGIRFKAKYLPWVMAIYTFIAIGAFIPWNMLIGIASGYIFYFLDTVYPANGGPRLIPTPPILYSLFPRQEVAGGRFAGNGRTANTYRPSQPDQGGHRWGTGYRLG